MRGIALRSFVSLVAFSATAVVVQAETLEEVVVTAQRRSERVQDVPISVSVLSTDDLQAAGVVDTTALSSSVPGLTTNTNASTFLPRIRGIGTSALASGNENPVALYVDDVYYGSQLMSIVNMDDVNQVAVLKGPQGTLFGRNATGGLIQLTTRDPAKEFGGELSTDLDNYRTSRSHLYLTGGLTDSLSTNFSASYATQGKGWGENTVDGRGIDKIHRDLSLRSKWLFEPSDDTKIKLSLDYTNRLNNLGPNSRPAKDTILNVPFVETSNIYDVQDTLNDRNKSEFGGASVKIDQSLGFAKLVSITSYRHYWYKTQFDLSLSAQPLQYIRFTNKGREFSQELQLASKDDSSNFKWIAGVFYYSTRDQNPVSLIQNFIPQTAPFLEEDFPQSTDNTTKSLSEYVQASWKFSSGTQISAGLRYTGDDRTQTGEQLGTFVHPPTDSIPPPPAPQNYFSFFSQPPFFDATTYCPTPQATFPVACTFTFYDAATPERKRGFSSLTWRAAIDQKFTPDVMGYASYNRGFKSGGFNGYNPANAPFNPEKVDAYELGLKSEFLKGQLRLNLAGFYNDYTNIQVQTFAGGEPVIFNAAAGKTYGVDFDFEAVLGGGFHLSGGLEWLESKFTDFPNADYYDYGLNSFGFPQYTLTERSATNNKFPFAPQFSGNLGLSYTGYFSFGQLDMDLRDAYNSGYYGEANNQVRQPAFNMLSASIGWKPRNSHFSISLYGRNLLNEEVATALYGYDYRGLSAQYGSPPRTYGGKIVFTF